MEPNRSRGLVIRLWRWSVVGLLLAGGPVTSQEIFWRESERLTCDPEERVFTPSVIKRVELRGFLETTAVARIRIVGGTATHNVDYEGLLVETLRFEPTGFDFDSRIWGVGVFDDDLEEPWETIEIEMEVSGGATLRGPSRARITILDDETRQPDDFTRCFQQIESGLEFVLTGVIDQWNREELRAPFRLQVFNNGSQARSGLVVQQVVPGFTQFQAQESSPGWVCPEGRGAGRVCHFELGVLEGRAEREIHFTAEIDSATNEAMEIFAEAVLLDDTQRSNSAQLVEKVMNTSDAVASDAGFNLGLCGPFPCSSDTVQSSEEWLAQLCLRVLGFEPGSEDGLRSSGQQVVSALAQVAEAARVLLRLRDRILLSDSGGRRALELLSEHASAMWNAARRDSGYVARAAQGASRWLPALGSLVEGDGDATVTAQMADDFVAFFEDLYPRAGAGFQTEAATQLERLDPSTWVGRPVREALDSFKRLECEPGEQSLCLRDGRFRVEVEWEDFEGGAGRGRRIQLTDDTGAFWFFDDANTELIVKVLDARGVNGHFWVFYGALSNVPYRIRVTDTNTGAEREYVNPSGRFSSFGDTTAFEGDASSFTWPLERKTASTSRAGSLAGAVATQPVELVQVGFPVDATDPDPDGIQRSGCVADGERLCLAGGRFEVSVDWSDFTGGEGSGRAVPISGDTGSFWFFDEDNLELVVKVLDARAINDRFWVFYGALSNVAYRIEIRDTVSGVVRTYDNALGDFASVGDTSAFDG